MIIAIIYSHIFVSKLVPDEEEIGLFILHYTLQLQRSVCTSAMFYLHKNSFTIGRWPRFSFKFSHFVPGSSALCHYGLYRVEMVEE